MNTKTDESIFKFFKQFSMFESALRISRIVEIDERANIQWKNLMDVLKQKNFKFTEEQKGLEIVKNPPKKMKFNKEDGIIWKEDFYHTDPELAIDSLRRIRNNLFHGGKELGNSSESERSLRLISEALIILDVVIRSLGIAHIHNDIVNRWS